MTSIREFLLQRPTGPLYHYTNAGGLVGILERKEIWASNALHLNDATESQYAFEVLRAELEQRLDNSAESAALSKRWKDFYEEWKGKIGSAALTDIETPVYVLSFSTNGNQLSQWRAYCRDDSGFSVGFTLSNIAYVRAASEFLLVKCVYQPVSRRPCIGPNTEPVVARLAVIEFLRKSTAYALGNSAEVVESGIPYRS
jgi:hypothetical protein